MSTGIEIAELLEYSAIGNLGDFTYVADAAKELRRSAGAEDKLETELVAVKAQVTLLAKAIHKMSVAAGICKEDISLTAPGILMLAGGVSTELARLAGVEAELAALREQKPQQVNDQLLVALKGLEAAFGDEYDDGELKEMDAARAAIDKAEVVEQKPISLPEWPEDRGEYPQKGLGVQS